MTTYTFNKQQVPGEPTGLVFYSDPACSNPATVNLIGGAPLPGSKVDRLPDGSWPLFQSTADQLYYFDANGVILSLQPSMTYTNPISVTGSRGTATAAVLENLIQALISAGVPIIDNTTA